MDEDRDLSRVPLGLLLLGLLVPAVIGICMLGALLIFFFAATANAAPAPSPAAYCAPYTELRTALKDKAKEEEIAFGLVDSKSALEIFATPQGETWTAVMVGANGMACIIASGTDFFQSKLAVGRPA